MIYRLTWCFARAVFVLLFRRRTIGRENVPRTGPVILASNHVSNLDPPVVATGIWRPCAFMAKEELFRNPLFGWFISNLNAFPVKRGAPDRAALKHSLGALERGMVLVMFPEGTRSETGELQEPEMGVGLIAYRSGAPIVPAYVEGTERVMPKGGGFKFATITVRYGQPFNLPPPEHGKAGRAEYESAAREIMTRIAHLRDTARSEG